MTARQLFTLAATRTARSRSTQATGEGTAPGVPGRRRDRRRRSERPLPRADAATFALHDAQLVLARAYGFESWPKLKAFVDGASASPAHRSRSCQRRGQLRGPSCRPGPNSPTRTRRKMMNAWRCTTRCLIACPRWCVS